jgi:hypothetical protein
MASGFMYVSPNARDAYLQGYMRALRRALGNILDGIPHQDLAIQIDVCQEVLLFEDYFPGRPGDYRERVFAELAELGETVPESATLGYHLCYGSPYDQHLVMPKDMGVLVELMQGILAAVARRVDFIHVPVPKDRTDEAYFEPLAGLALPSHTRLYLGLVHFDDETGDLARIRTAGKFVADFGVASECGWGRTDPARVPGLLASHRRAAEHLAGGDG